MIKKQKATKIQKSNNDNKNFQYAVTVPLNHENIEKNAQRVSKINPLINKYNWKERSFPSHKKDWKKFESNNKSVSLNT